MRHLNRGRKLNRTSSHRQALIRNLTAALIRRGRIFTTPAKAKEARPFAERMITLAKRGPDNLAARRRAIRLLHDPALVNLLFKDIGLRYKDRQGGYTRILHLSRARVGDGARQVLFELVEGGIPAGGKPKSIAAAVAEPPAKPAVIEEIGSGDPVAVAPSAGATDAADSPEAPASGTGGDKPAE
ncbi:MAG: 50S ribosomal protein L17 [Planctomycetota bacterium]|jgi:large subunit ribosomal protein L17|nr:50S ribosomal protein L17 [Planctomycetota bacterium]